MAKLSYGNTQIYKCKKFICDKTIDVFIAQYLIDNDINRTMGRVHVYMNTIRTVRASVGLDKT